ncbi:hypothetical protein BU16DRAFT_615938 [Lophium mytilinum]|uniref:Uncharacterized protein n=1 Tax=Lophium mytilinum TaxID=390894 RepID=A0A6A6R3A6_9PEZI|nr:hypothetical protein BU16DRAFT_615938 [Lophium mytilinum]
MEFLAIISIFALALRSTAAPVNTTVPSGLSPIPALQNGTEPTAQDSCAFDVWDDVNYSGHHETVYTNLGVCYNFGGN